MNLSWTKSLFNSNDSRFMLWTALKVTLIPVIGLVFTGYGLWIFLQMVHAFFLANGFPVSDVFQEAFYDFIFSDLTGYFPFILAYVAFLFFAGMYLAYLMLRPYKRVAKHAVDMMGNEYMSVKTSGIEKSDLLIRFSTLFFDYLLRCQKANTMSPQDVGDEFESIKGPIFNRAFFVQYGSVLAIIVLITAPALYFFTMGMYDAITTLALKMLKAEGQTISLFFNSLEGVMVSIFLVSIGLIVLLYLLVATSIARQANGVSYAIFRVMREIVKGNHKQRIRLRLDDPGHDEAADVNELLDVYFRNGGPGHDSVAVTPEADGAGSPPPLPPLPPV